MVVKTGKRRPFYARLLRLRHVRPGGLLCFLFFEGSLLLAILLAMAELVDWWAVPVLPAVVAVMVKINDLVAGASRPPPGMAEPTVARVSVVGEGQLQEVDTVADRPVTPGPGAGSAVTGPGDSAGSADPAGPANPAGPAGGLNQRRRGARQAGGEPEIVRAARRSDARRFER